MKELLEKALEDFLTGIDPGNITTKVSFLNEKGDIENFTIPTVIAPAPTAAIAYNSHAGEKEEIAIEDFIHIQVNSDAMNKDENNRAWYVGESAKVSIDKLQPEKAENGDSEEKFSDKNRDIFVLPVLAGIAVAAVKAGKNEVVAPLSIGIPSKSYLKQEQTLKNRFIGRHVITFLDGPFAEEVVTIYIKEDKAQIHAEGVTTALALMYDIESGDLLETNLHGTLNGKTYTVADLGAGTSDFAVFNENGLDKVMTRRFAVENEGELSRVGTSTYIDRIINSVYNDPQFAKNKETMERLNDPRRKPAELTSREIFMKKVVKPAVDIALEKGVEPKFSYSWARTKNVDITDYVIDEMKKYARTQIDNIDSAWISANTDHIVAVGGGLLFGYFGGLNELDGNEVIIPNLIDSQYFTSKAYLIANYLVNMQQEELV